MFSREGTQFIVFFVLSLIGVWIAHKDLTPPSQGGFLLCDGLIAAMYWFCFLLYALLSFTFGLALRRHSWKWLLLVHLYSVSISLAATVEVVKLGQQYAAEGAQRESLDRNEIE